MAKSFDMSKFNTFIQQASDSIMCNSECQKQRETEKLKQKYDNAQTNLASASNQVQVAQRNYVTYAQGEMAYDDLHDKELHDKASLVAETFSANFDEECAKIQTQINSYNGLYMNYDNVQELYLKYEKENLDLFKELKKTSNDVLTNERKTYYEDQSISNLRFYYFYFLLGIYIVCVICFGVFSLLYPSQYSFIVRISILAVFIALPFVATWVLGMLLYLLYGGYHLLPKNVYAQKNF